jgi:hypothetical protein
MGKQQFGSGASAGWFFARTAPAGFLPIISVKPFDAFLYKTMHGSAVEPINHLERTRRQHDLVTALQRWIDHTLFPRCHKQQQ